MKAVSEKRLRSFFEPLLHRLQPSASKMLNEEVLISLVRVKVEFLVCLIISITPSVCVGHMNLNLSTILARLCHLPNQKPVESNADWNCIFISDFIDIFHVSDLIILVFLKDYS